MALEKIILDASEWEVICKALNAERNNCHALAKDNPALYHALIKYDGIINKIQKQREY